MTPRKGTFRKGNPGGPGRPRKIRSEEDVERSFVELQLPSHRPPPPLPPDADFITEMLHEQDRKHFEAFGYWLQKYAIPKSDLPRLLKAYKRQKILDPTITLAAVWQKMIPEILEQ